MSRHYDKDGQVIALLLRSGCELERTLRQLEVYTDWPNGARKKAWFEARYDLVEVIWSHIREGIAEGNRYERRMSDIEANGAVNKIIGMADND